MKRIAALLGLFLSTTSLAGTFEGFYAGPAFSAGTDHHIIGGQGIHHKKKNDHKRIDAILGYGITLANKDIPLYLGVEAYIPLKNEHTSKEIESIIGGVRQKNTHELSKVFPAEGAFKIGFPIDEKVMVYGKIGFVHQRFKHKVQALNHSTSWTTTSPLYGAGLSLQVNGKWIINGEFTAHNTPTHNTLIFSHDHKHQRIQMTIGYRF